MELMRPEGRATDGLVEFCQWLVKGFPLPEGQERHRLIEIGSYAGESADVFCEYFDVTCVDPWSSDPAYMEGLSESHDIIKAEAAFDRRIGDRARKLKMSGEAAATLLADELFSFVYIDAVHTYAGVKRDIEIWQPRVDLAVCGHDYDSINHPGVREAIDELFGRPDEVFDDKSWLHDLRPAKEIILAVPPGV